MTSLAHEAAVWRERAWTVGRVVRAYVVVRWSLARRGLPATVRSAPVGGQPWVHPIRLSRQVHLLLRFGGERNVRCVHRAVVLQRLLVGQGDPASVVIGLPPTAPGARAHAWVELRGHDIGPPPGRGEHVELARFP